MSACSPIIASLLAALAAATPARAPAPPRHTDDIDMPSGDKKPPSEEAAASDTPDDDGSQDAYIPGRPDLVRPTDKKGRKVEGSDAGVPADAGSADAGVATAADKQIRPIVLPPSDGDAQLVAAWAERRRAMSHGVVHEMLEQEKRVLKLREDLGYDNLFAAAAVVCRESEGLLKTDGAEAVRRAVFASEIAPDLPAAHWTVARAAFHEDLTNAGRYLGSSVEAVKATWREPRARAALIAEVAAALLCAFLLAAGACIALVFLRHARYFLHDFHHLFPPGAWHVQTALAGLLVVSLPLLFRLGPVAFLFALALATWLQMDRGERIVIALLFVLIGFAPQGAALVEQYSTFSGTRAESLYLVEKGGPDAFALAQVQALGEKPDAPYEALFALGHRARRHGEAQAAVALLRQAGEQRQNAVETLIELGNALFLAGDLDGARDSYQRVLNSREASAEAHYNLGRLFDRRAQMVSREEAAAQLGESQTHSHRAIDLDPRLGAALAGEADLRANRFLAGAGLDDAELWAMAAGEAHPGWIADGLSAKLFGPLPRAWSWLAGLIAAALLGVATLLRSVVVPSGPCSKCGRPVCRRCDDEVVGPGLCGQCVNVFARRGAVDPPARAAKEMGIRRHQRHRIWLARFWSIVLCGAGQTNLGKAWQGLLLSWIVALGGWIVAFPGGLVPAPWGASPVALRLIPAVLVAALAWLFGVRLAFRHTAAMNLLKLGAQPAAPEAAPKKPDAGALPT